MTVIAYRSGTLSADSLVTTGDTRTASVIKISKNSDGFLAGACGSASACAAFHSWFNAGMQVDGLRNCSSGDFSALIINPKGIVHLCDGREQPYPISGKFFAIGSGGDFAIGAMELGASAEQAVKAAIKHCTSCGGKVVSKSLSKPTK